MTTIDRRDVLVLDEFRLLAADTDGATAGIVSAARMESRDPVPLLTSIDDPRDVATLRTLSAEGPEGKGPRGEAALGPLVATWQTARRYRARIAARSQGPPATSFRLAVTESGIHDEKVAPTGTWAGAATAGQVVALLLIGVPERTHAGLLVLVGRETAEPAEAGRDGMGWAQPLSRGLGVRLYASDGWPPRHAAPHRLDRARQTATRTALDAPGERARAPCAEARGIRRAASRSRT